ncbi:MAG: hypothetical protein GY830_05075 [Bacteroidetes bacterium]|nr:hypothetical protein [Bacteroidota bacterium]
MNRNKIHFLNNHILIIAIFILSYSKCTTPNINNDKEDIDNSQDLKTQNEIEVQNTVNNNLQPPSLNKNNKAFVFDFDLTLTMEHTGGYPDDHDLDYIFANENNISKIKTMFKKIKQKGYNIYINSRGVKREIENKLKKAKLLKYISKVYGAREREDVSNPLFLRKVWEGKTQNEKPTEQWALIKTYYLDQIAKQGFNPNNIYFFDDTSKNIEKASYKYPNSYKIDKNHRLNQTISKVNNILIVNEKHLKPFDFKE